MIETLGKKIAAVTALAGLGGAALLGVDVYNNSKWARECFAHIQAGKPLDCVGNVQLPSLQSKPAPITVHEGNLKVLNEKQIGTKAFFTFGENEITVSGQGKIDYIETNWLKSCNPIPGRVCGTFFHDPKPVTLKYTPCMEIAADYTQIVKDKKAQYYGDIALSIVQVEDPTTHALSSKVVAKTPPIVACNVYIDTNNRANEDAFHHQGIDKQGFEKTIHYIGENLMVDYATANNCAADLVNQEAVKQTVTTWVHGLEAEDPQYQQFLTAPVEVQVGDATVAHQQLEAVFHQQVLDFKGWKKTLPDSAGAVYDIKNMDIKEETFAVNKCVPTAPQMQLSPG